MQILLKHVFSMKNVSGCLRASLSVFLAVKVSLFYKQSRTTDGRTLSTCGMTPRPCSLTQRAHYLPKTQNFT